MAWMWRPAVVLGEAGCDQAQLFAPTEGAPTVSCSPLGTA